MMFHMMKIQRGKRDCILLVMFQLYFAFLNLWNKDLKSKDLILLDRKNTVVIDHLL